MRMNGPDALMAGKAMLMELHRVMATVVFFAWHLFPKRLLPGKMVSLRWTSFFGQRRRKLSDDGGNVFWVYGRVS